MKITMLYFAQLREAAGQSEQVMDLESGITVGEFARQFLQQPAFRQYQGLPFRYALNDEFAAPEDIIPEGALIALLPPVSGG